MTLTNPWPGRGWPFDADEEAAFVAALGRRRPTRDLDSETRRSHITLVVGALRNGTDVADITAIAPGLELGALAGAYRDVARLVERSMRAWEKLCGEPSAKSLKRWGAEVAKVLPTTVERLGYAPETGDAGIAVIVAVEQGRIETLWRHYDTAQAALHRDNGANRDLIDTLYHPEKECLVLQPRFLPRRVGELSPFRLARLLGETTSAYASDMAFIDDDSPAPPTANGYIPASAAARARPGRSRR